MAAVGGAGAPGGGAGAAAAPNDLGPEVQPRDLVVSGIYYVRRFSEFKKVRVSRIRLAGPTPNDLFIDCIQTNGATPVYGVGPARDPARSTKFYDVYSPQHELEMRVGFTKSTGTSGARGTGPANIINSFLSSKKSTPRRRKRSRKTRTAKRRQ